MKRRKTLTLICGPFLLCVLFFTLTGPKAQAETSYGAEDWNVTFTVDEKMQSNFGMQDLDDVISGLQPGDNAFITLYLKNGNEASTDWYMTNEVIHSLEDRSENAATYGGAYTYNLTYTNSVGEVSVLFSSDTVGGDISDKSADDEGGEGLHEATDSLETFFYLDTLTTGQSGYITLEVALDGESQGNDYQDTMADLQMNFAVELTRTSTTTTVETSEPNTPSQDVEYRVEYNTNNTYTEHNSTTPNIQYRIRPVKTSDDSIPVPILAAMSAFGILLMVLALYSLKHSFRRGKEGQSDETTV